MAVAAALPGLTVEVLRPPAEQSPLRSDVAGFVGRTRRGPVAVPVRVAGRRDLEAGFGGLDARFAAGYSLRGYFENGGEVVHVVRLPGEGAAAAEATWTVGELVGPPDAPVWAPDAPAGAGFGAASYRVLATSPGTWADDTRVMIAYRANGLARRHELELRVEVPGEEPELYDGVAPAELEQAMAASRFVRFAPVGPPAPAGADTGPTVKRWDPVVLGARISDAVRYLAEHIHQVPVHVIPCVEGRTDHAPVVVQASRWDGSEHRDTISPGVHARPCRPYRPTPPSPQPHRPRR